MTLRELRKHGINQNGLVLFIKENLTLYIEYDEYSSEVNKPTLYVNGTIHEDFHTSFAAFCTNGVNKEALIDNLLTDILEEEKLLGKILFLLCKQASYTEEFRKKEIDPFIDKEINIEYM